MQHVIEVDLGVLPPVAEVRQVLAVAPILHHIVRQLLLVLVDALVEATLQQLHARDAEQQPEHNADEEHVGDGRDGVDQGVHHNLFIPETIQRCERLV